MREPFALEAPVVLEAGADVRALGGAVTLALCGAFQPPGPCPLAPHRTGVAAGTDATEARVIGACDPDRLDGVLAIGRAALASGAVTDPSGVEQHRRLLEAHPGEVREDERDLADRLAASA